MESEDVSAGAGMDARDCLFLEEYKQTLKFILAANETLHRFARFYFTCITIFFSAFFYVVKDGFGPEHWVVVVLPQILILITLAFWYSNASRTKVKMASRMQRAKEIESHFTKNYDNCLQMLTYTGKHLDENRDCQGKDLNLLERQTGMISEKFPVALMIISLLLLGMVICQLGGWHTFFPGP